MALKIVIAPDYILEQVARPVKNINDKLKRILIEMLELMYESRGMGLAAPQVGISKRFFVMDNPEDDNPPCFFINPIIIKQSKNKSELDEGCLSLPNQRIKIQRPESIILEYLDINWKKHIESFDGLSATCIQHEIDHLNGIIITDHIESTKEYREAIKKSLRIKQSIENQENDVLFA